MLRLRSFLCGVLLILLCGSPSAESLPQTTNSRPNSSQRDASPAVPNSGTAAAPDPKTSIHFRDVSPQVGITTVPHTRLDRHYVLDTMAGGGVARYHRQQRLHAQAEQAGREAILALRITTTELNVALERAEWATERALVAKNPSDKWGE